MPTRTGGLIPNLTAYRTVPTELEDSATPVLDPGGLLPASAPPHKLPTEVRDLPDLLPETRPRFDGML